MIDIFITTNFKISSKYEILDEGDTVDGVVLKVHENFVKNYYDPENLTTLTIALYKHTDFLEEIGLLYEDFLPFENGVNDIHVWVSNVVIGENPSIEVNYEEEEAFYEETMLKLSNGLFEPVNF